jgi:hypothetical protein
MLTDGGWARLAMTLPAGGLERLAPKSRAACTATFATLLRPRRRDQARAIGTGDGRRAYRGSAGADEKLKRPRPTSITAQTAVQITS